MPATGVDCDLGRQCLAPGRRMYPWRAVDSEGEILDMLVQPRRDKAAALRLMHKLLKKQGFAPKVLVTDKLRSYAAARREPRFSAHREQATPKQRSRELPSSGSTTGAENAAVQVNQIRPTSLAAHAAVHNTFNLERHLISRRTLRLFRAAAAQQWQIATAAA